MRCHLTAMKTSSLSCVRSLSGALLLISICWSPAEERLDRGVVAFPAKDGGVYIGWRLFGSDPADVTFDVFRSDTLDGVRTRLNDRPIGDSTNFTDQKAPAKKGFYVVRALSGSRILDESSPVLVDEAAEIGGFRRLKFQGNYGAQKVGLGDFNGDGRLDYLIKQPDFNSDPYQQPGYWKPSPEPYKLEAYDHAGRLLWRYDMGWAIETGIWYSPIVVYDLDGDNQAEVYCKAGEPGDPRNERGLVTTGPEYLVKLDSRTGKVVAKLDWPNRDGFGRGETAEEPDYNYWSRNLLAIAYLDGSRPHLIVQRGTYTLTKIRAYDPDLKLVWTFESKGPYAAYKGQGAHGLPVADIDQDGRDELVIGAAAIDDDGKPLWTTGRGHPDICYVGDIDPLHPGLEVFYGHERKMKRDAVCLVEARTGKTLWSYDGPTSHVHGQGMVADIDPTRPGLECYAGEQDGSNYWLYDAQGTRLSDKSLGELSPRAVWWTADHFKLVISQHRLFQFNGPDYGTVPGRIIAVVDCLGDWREELLVSVDGELRIYSTTIPARTRRVCLMQDRAYRLGVASQTMGYYYPPIPRELGWLGPVQRPAPNW
jgi:rhamnogalacturonan endolyase